MPKLPLDKVAEAADQVARTERITAAAKMRLAKYVREADRARIPKAEIARAAGVSRPTVYELLRRG